MAISDWTLPETGSAEKQPTDWSKLYPTLGGSSGASAHESPVAASDETVATTPNVQPPSGPVHVSEPASATEKTAADYEKMGWGDVASSALSNAPASAGHVFSGLYDAVTNPSQTWEGVKQLGSGIVSKASGALGGDSHPEKENVLNALLGEYADTYGSMGGFKKKLAEDPFFIGMDAATMLGGAGAVGKAAGVSEKALNALNVAGKIADPVQGALAVAKLPVKLGTAVGKTAAATASGVPKSAFDLAEAAGASADPMARKAFAAAAAGKIDSQALADKAVSAVDDLKKSASAEYKASHAALDRTPVDTAPIWNKIKEIEDQLGAHTPTTVNGVATTVGRAHWGEELDLIQQMKDKIEAIDNSTNLADKTVDGVDSVKKSIDAILRQYRGGKLGLLGEVPASAKAAINSVDKNYGAMLDRWTEWRKQMQDLKSQLTGTDKTSDSAIIVKLMKTLKDDRKRSLLDMLAKTPSGQYLPEMIAGHAVSGWKPAGGRGLVDLLAGGGLYYAGAHPAALIGGAALASPKVGGQLANKAGMATRMAGAATPPQAAMQPLSMMGNLEEGQQPAAYKRGGKVGGRHEAAADQLVRAAERAKKGWSATTEPLLNQSDDVVAHALEVANRSI